MAINLEKIITYSSEIFLFVLYPGEVLAIISVIVFRENKKFISKIFLYSIAAATLMLIFSEMAFQKFIPPTPLESFVSNGTLTANLAHRPNIIEFMCALAGTAIGFCLALYQMRTGRRVAGRLMLLVSCSALSALGVFAGTTVAYFGYQALIS